MKRSRPGNGTKSNPHDRENFHHLWIVHYPQVLSPKDPKDLIEPPIPTTMAITLSRPNGRGNSLYFKCRRLKKRSPVSGGVLNYVTKLSWVEITVDGVKQKVKFQDSYTCSPGTFASIAAATPGKTYAETVLDRPANTKCIMRDSGVPHVGHAGCNLTNFYNTKDYHRSLELRETQNMGVGVFATAPIPKGTVIGVYTGDLVQMATLTPDEKRYTAEIRTLPSGETVLINAFQRGNWTRFINHSCKPNCGRFKVAMNCGSMMVYYVRTEKAIAIGEELSVDYGREYFREDNGRGRALIIGSGCLCGRSGCHSKKRRR